MKRSALLLIIAAIAATCLGARGRRVDSLALERMWKYAASIKKADTTNALAERGVYMRYRYQTERRNILLLPVPRLYAIAHGPREFAGETVFKMTANKDSSGYEAIRQMDVSTVPHHSNATPAMQEYLSPTIYEEKMFQDKILSPFYYHNRVFYRYQTRQMEPGRVEIRFSPKLDNTQLVKGKCVVDTRTGRVVNYQMQGEFDMLRFKTNGVMGKKGRSSLYPDRLDLEVRFSLLGNRLNTWFHGEFNLKPLLPDSVRDNRDMALAEKVRPTPLPKENQKIYKAYQDLHKDDTATVTENKDERRLRRTLEDIGESLVSNTRSSFGRDDKGSFKLSPFISPFSFGYNSSRGIYYKMKLDLGYDLSPNSRLSIEARGGYSFKQRLIYYSVPLRYTWNVRRNNYAELVVRSGNRIGNSEIRDRIKEQKSDDIDWDAMGLDYFKDFRMDLNTNIALSKKWAIMPGITYHRRSAVNPDGFILAGRQHVYKTAAPRLGIQWKPMGDKGVVITIENETSIKKFLGSDFGYERNEFDAVWKCEFKRMKSLSMRGGLGFYTSRGNETYFLDYTNFSQENIPGGWNDNWTGDFQLLNSNWYNSSNIYLRGNVTYESPFMLVSKLPWVGRFIEMERIYVNQLYVEKITPYTEVGYGFTNRLFSTGVFMALKQASWHGIGVRFDIQLFNRW